jgi:enamine deaminase RidA (YjgF/YER057c/UK114 family)
VSTTAAGTTRQRLARAGIELPEVTAPASNYLPVRRFGDLVFSAGVTSEGMTGTVGADTSLDVARDAAGLCVRRQLAFLERELATLDVIASVIRLTGYVACRPGFPDTPRVIDAGSDVLVAAFGDAGRHARSAVGVSALPGGALVEIELILSVVGAASDRR